MDTKDLNEIPWQKIPREGEFILEVGMELRNYPSSDTYFVGDVAPSYLKEPEAGQAREFSSGGCGCCSEGISVREWRQLISWDQDEKKWK